VLKSKFVPVFFVFLLLSIVATPFMLNGVAFAEGAATDHIKQQIGGDEIEKQDDTGYMEEMLAEIIVAIPKFLVEVLHLQDMDELIFGAGSDKIMGTFDEEVWNVTSDFYNVFMEASNYLLVFAVVVWGYLIIFRGSSAQGQSVISEMAKGILIYVFGIYLAGYIFDIVFEANAIIIELAKSGLEKTTGWNPEDFKMLTMFEMSTESVPEALLLLFIAFSIGLLNFQYAVRMVVLMFLIIIFPLCAYASIFPGAQKTLDTWFREFCSQVFTQSGHALAYALFLSLLYSHTSFWILIAFLISMPTVSGMIRIVFGAPGAGTFGGGSGLGSLKAMKTIMHGITNRGKGAKLQSESGSNQAVSNAVSNGSIATAGVSDGSTGFGLATGAPNPLANFFQNGDTKASYKSGGEGATFSDFAQANGGKNGLAKSAAAVALGTATRATAMGTKAAVSGAVGGAAYVVGTALTGSEEFGSSAALFAGKKFGTPLANAGGKVMKGAYQSVRNAAGQVRNSFKEFMKDKPIVEVEKPPLALPPGSSAPQLALPVPPDAPPVNQAKLPGTYETPLADGGGVMINQTPTPRVPIVDFPQPPRPDLAGQTQTNKFEPYVSTSQGTSSNRKSTGTTSSVGSHTATVGNYANAVNRHNQNVRQPQPGTTGTGTLRPTQPQGQRQQVNAQGQTKQVPNHQANTSPRTQRAPRQQVNMQNQARQIPNQQINASRHSQQVSNQHINVQGLSQQNYQQASNQTVSEPKQTRPINSNDDRGINITSKHDVQPVIEMVYDGRGFTAFPPTQDKPPL
jgi:hypothetical protein